jgi:radical SAM superfamily enzyme YgiQ (UPF0313 family)
MDLPRLLLVEPPFYRLHTDNYGLCKYPLGVASLAAVIMESGLAEVRVFNGDFHPDPVLFSVDFLAGEGFQSYRRNLTNPDHPAYADLKRLVETYCPDVVGISVKTPVLASALACARIVKEVAPETLVVFGGPHPSVTGSDLLIRKEVDMVVYGEGDAVIVELMKAVSSGRGLEEIHGISFRRDGVVVTTPHRPVITDLDALPFVHRYAPQVLEGYHRYPLRALGHVFSARGCPFTCTFCSSRGVWTGPVRFRSHESLLDELAGLCAMGLSHIHFDDDTFGVTGKRLVALCRSLEKARLGLTFSCETHVSLITEATVTAMVRGGFTTVQLGLESGDDAMLRRIGKGFTVKQALEAAGLVKSAGLRLEAFFMVGFPDETEDSLNATRRLMETLEADKLIYSIFTPYPGTPLFEQCRGSGLIHQGYDYSLHSHQSPENAFCPKIGKERFRSLASEIESLVAAKNAAPREPLAHVLKLRPPPLMGGGWGEGEGAA